MDSTIRAKLLTKKEGLYTLYVFQDLDTGAYIMCTKLPNWGQRKLEVNSTGFLTLDYVVAGEPYFDRNNQKGKVYNYTQIYFKEFIPETIKEDITL